jgi:hypothetical protein
LLKSSSNTLNFFYALDACFIVIGCIYGFSSLLSLLIDGSSIYELFIDLFFASFFFLSASLFCKLSLWTFISFFSSCYAFSAILSYSSSILAILESGLSPWISSMFYVIFNAFSFFRSSRSCYLIFLDSLSSIVFNYCILVFCSSSSFLYCSGSYDANDIALRTSGFTKRLCILPSNS